MGIFRNVFLDGDHASESDVRLGVDYANDSLTGLVAVPLDSEVLLSVPVDQSLGNVRLPVETDVRITVVYGPNDTLVGVLDDSGETADYPAVSDVRLGVIYALGALTGDVRVPPADRVEFGYQYDTVDSVTGELGTPSGQRDWVTR